MINPRSPVPDPRSLIFDPDFPVTVKGILSDRYCNLLNKNTEVGILPVSLAIFILQSQFKDMFRAVPVLAPIRQQGLQANSPFHG